MIYTVVRKCIYASRGGCPNIDLQALLPRLSNDVCVTEFKVDQQSYKIAFLEDQAAIRLMNLDVKVNLVERPFFVQACV